MAVRKLSLQPGQTLQTFRRSDRILYRKVLLQNLLIPDTTSPLTLSLRESVGYTVARDRTALGELCRTKDFSPLPSLKIPRKELTSPGSPTAGALSPGDAADESFP